MKKVAITGGIGSGKTYISKMFSKLGVPIYNSDQKANSIIKSNYSVDLINYAENIGAEPFLFVGEIVKVKNWVYCVG